MTPPRLNTLTSLRYLFAAGAVAVHLLPVWAENDFPHWPPVWRNLLNAAYLALPFFYALSGFVLYYMYREPTQQPRTRAQHFYFWGKRFARLTPIFYLSLALGLTQYLAGGQRISGQTIASLGVNVAFLSAWLPKTLVFNFPTWSVSVEMFCYFLFPLLLPLFIGLTRRQAWAGVALTFLAGILIQLTAALFYPALWRWPWEVVGVSPELTGFLELHPFVHFPEFLFGIFLARVWEQRAPELDRHCDALLLGGFAVILVMLLSGIQWPFLMLTSFLFLPAIGLLLWGGAGPRGAYARWLEWPLLLLLGEASYAVYGFHMPLSYWFGKFLPVTTFPYLFFLAFLLFLTAASIAMHRLFELRARAWLMGCFARWK